MTIGILDSVGIRQEIDSLEYVWTKTEREYAISRPGEKSDCIKAHDVFHWYWFQWFRALKPSWNPYKRSS